MAVQLSESDQRSIDTRGWRPGRRHPLVWFVARRLAIGLALLWVVSVLTFAATQILPGNVARAVLGRGALPAQIDAFEERLGLDRPLAAQYLDWVGSALQGDLGRSFGSNEPVSGLIVPRLWNSIALAFVTLLLLVPISIALGVLAGIRRDQASDRSISWLSLCFIAIPEFVVATFLITVFAVSLNWLPAITVVSSGQSPLSDPAGLVLPVLSLLLVSLAYAVRMIRAGVIEVMSSSYVRMARLQGISERRIVTHHALRNALAPTVQVLALTLQWLIGGLVIVEAIFGYPGIGQALVQAVASRDIPTVQGIAIIIAAIYIVINIVADLLVVLLVPKLRTTV